MDPGYSSPLIDAFKRGEPDKELRMLAASGALASKALEQLALLVLLVDDPDPEVAVRAQETLSALPPAAVESFLRRDDVPHAMREFFRARGLGVPAVRPAGTETDAATAKLLPAEVRTDEDDQEVPSEEEDPTAIQNLSVVQRVKLAMKGTAAQRAILVRDPNKMVSTAVMNSPKLTESEVEAIAKMGNVSEDVLRIIGNNRTWTKNYSIVAALARNPKSPPAISMQMVQRLNERDMKALSVDRNVPEAVRLIARKFVLKALK